MCVWGGGGGVEGDNSAILSVMLPFSTEVNL